MWIGDFVRGHTAVRLLKERWPNRPVDLLSTTLCAPLADYMPGVRQAIVYDLPRGRIALDKQKALAAILRQQNYQTALMMPIMAPLSDLLGISRDAAVIAYQTGAGLMELVTPTNGALLAVLLGARTDWGRWIRFAIPGALLVAIVCLTGIALA